MVNQLTQNLNFMKKKCLLLLFLCLFSVSFTFSQNITVTGTVTDELGELPEANIQVKGTNKGTVTNSYGKYTINVKKGSVLIFSFIGYKSKEITANKSIINVTLKEDSNLLEEAVVTAFGVKKKERSLGYAVQKVKAEDIVSTGRTNPLEALQGQVSGVMINKSSGSAGGGLDILIRGATSIDPNRNNQPLMIIDGVVINNDTFTGNVLPSEGSNTDRSSEQFSFSSRGMDINPEDIESYSVLKGAAATALYGEKAANGAIVITTKRGKLGSARVTISSSVTVRNVQKTPELQSTYREGHRTTMKPGVIINPNKESGYEKYGFSFYSWGPKYTENSWDYGNGIIGDLSKDKFHNTYKDFFRTGINRQLNLSLSGATEKAHYYFSIGNSRDEGIVPNTDYTKTNFRLRGGYKISDNFEVNTSIGYTNSGGKRSTGGDKSIFSSLSYWSPTFPINDYQYADGSQKNYTGGVIDNPRYYAERSNLKDKVNRWIGNAEFNWKPNNWISVVYRAQVDNYSDQRNRFVPKDLDVGTKVGGFIVEEDINYLGLESNFLATFQKDFSEGFKTSLLIGHQLRDNKRDYGRVRGEALNSPTINKLSNATNFFTYDDVVIERNMGVFADLRLEFKNKLFLSVTGRNDWNSTLPKNNRSYFYPSISASYLFSEDLFNESEVVSFGKLRASWAKVGKGTQAGQVGYYYIPDPNFPFSGSGGFRSDVAVGDTNLKPEISKSYEIGGDIRFINNRFRLDYSYYNTVVNDQIFPLGVPYSSGIQTIVRNAGTYKTWGHELLLSADIIKNEDFKWKTSINWSTNKGKVVDLPEDLGNEVVFFNDRVTSKAKKGDALGTLYGWVFQTVPTGERYVGPEGKWIVTGSENKGFYYQGGNEMVKVGNAMPDYILSLNNHFSWKNFDISFLLEYKAGGDVYDRGYRNAIRNGNLKETEFRNQTRILSGMMDDGNGGYTKNTQELLITANSFYRDFNNYNMASDILLQDASWVKLRSISLAYNFNKELLEKIKIKNATISFTASNILLWTPFKGFDPESNQFSAGSNIYGFTGLNVPLTQDYSLGLKLDF